MRSFTDIKDLSKSDIEAILFRTKQEKKVIAEKGNLDIEKILLGKTVALIFEKPSTRTRVSFEVGISQLGGYSSVLQASDIQLSRGESISDTARVSSVPVINGLTDQSHPCQVMADILTIEENKGSLSNQNILWIGDGNNVSRSWVEASSIYNFQITLCTPKELSLPIKLIENSIAKGANITIDYEPESAINNKDVIITDTWLSMGDNSINKENSLKPYQVNRELIKKARKDAVFMHCLPAHRGKEVTNEVIDSNQSIVFAGAENRLHVQRSIIWWCLKND